MAEAAPNHAVDSSATKALKDKSCPFCSQAFTSSSLGRHLDLYIKPKNPKAPDGIHLVEAIRKMRGNITRRQPRASLARRDTSTPAGTPTAASRKSPGSDADSSYVKSPVPAQQKEAQNPADLTANLYPFTPRWEATGVMNDIPGKNGETPTGREGEGSQDPAGRSLQPRAASRQVVKTQWNMKQKVQDALDTARAAELALREILGSYRAAKQHVRMNSTPFDFEPLSLDFAALTLQCLQPPPTLYSSTQHPTPTSWSINPPAAKQHEALKSFFKEEFRKWKITCAAATTATYEELSYPPSANSVQPDVRDAVRRAEKAADALERQVSDHVKSAFSVWEGLSPQRRSELWILELARSMGRKQKEVDKLKETQHALRQENESLRSQIDHLNRLQQPREFKILPPATIPMPEPMIMFMHEEGVVKGRTGVGLNIDDRHADLNTLTATAIERWKAVILSARAASGMNAQRPLDQTPALSSASAGNPLAWTPSRAPPQQPQPSSIPTLKQPLRPRQAATAPPPSAPAFDHHGMSDQDADADADADAEMEDDDGFAEMSASIVKPPPREPQQQTPQLEVPRTRGPIQRMATGSSKTNFAMNNTNRSATHPGHGGAPQMSMSPPMPDMNSAMLGHDYARHAATAHHAGHPDMGMAMQGVGGDAMYMD